MQGKQLGTEIQNQLLSALTGIWTNDLSI